MSIIFKLVCCSMILFVCKGCAQKIEKIENEHTIINLNAIKYKSDETNELLLDFKNLTYSYKEKYSPNAGEDVGYENDSRGKFLIKNDTITFVSDMPSEIDVKMNWNTNTEFLQLYPTKEKIDKNLVKIYFDNIAEIEYYSAYEYSNGIFKKLKIKEIKSGDYLGEINTKNDRILLFKYLLIEKPLNNRLLIVNNERESISYFFDLNIIPFSSFHFYTRAYWSYYDFTGLKFRVLNNSIKLIDDNRLNRFNNSVVNNLFVKQ